jgi:sulfur-oxidizing protein SoxY
MPVGTELSPAVSRRSFLGLAGAVAGLMVVQPGMRRAWGGEPASAGGFDRPLLRVPAATSNGARVPIVVDAVHPMERHHHVGMLEVINPRDPVPGKGRFEFTPENGRAYVTFQARLDEGPSTLVATAECSRHGRSTATAPISIAVGGGGCAGSAPAAQVDADEIRPPVIRIPQLIAEGQIRAERIIDVQVKVKHPNRTGLIVREGKFVQDSEPFHLDEMAVFYGSEQVSRFLLSAALSDNPMITFKLRARPGAMVRVTLTNTRRQRFEATHQLPLV